MPAMLDWAEYTKFLLALLVIVNLIGAVPLFVSMTAGNTVAQRKNIARVASTAVDIPMKALAGIGQAAV